MITRAQALRQLRDASDLAWPDALDHVSTERDALEALQAFDGAGDPEWVQAARERELWISHVLERLEQASGTASVPQLLRAVRAAAVELGALAVLLESAVDATESTEEDRELQKTLALQVARNGARAFSTAQAAWDLTRTLQEP